ncbi:type 1 glutamine amidotransferase [Halomonas dongshanensis]|uniref:Type 1 glutamine amidotransferase n=1 Tax=Halomonas dongshanensis TaxID=2890835 RepID=A0ABT2EHJ2_9GAMM|nr:type 1 glutamine amidotransferase [Halomonas dongshanensis]MCS2611082.1 type 1 glutamine amidotransferase [Halomonas dongshanensis]
MHIHLLQHGPAHVPARLTDWLSSMGHSFTIFHLDQGELVPRPGDCDALIVLDGNEALVSDPPSWQRAENKLIQRLLDGEKPLLGIGLGAHRIAAALGAIVAPGTFAERGWQTLTKAPESPLDLPERFEALMCHRLVFSLPDDALPLGGSEASPLAGFSWDGCRVIGLLCQLHATPGSARALLAEDAPAAIEAGRGRFIHSDEEILADAARFAHQAPLLDRLLTQWLRSAG